MKLNILRVIFSSLFLLFFLVFPLWSFEVDATLKFHETEDGYRVEVINNEPFEIFLSIDFDLTAYDSSVSLPAILPLARGSHPSVLSLHRVEGARRFSYRVNYSFLYADPRSVEVEAYLYYFPFAHGTAHRIGQGWNGSFSHYGQNQYAVDFDMDEGTDVYAARDGIVVSLKEDSRRGGASSSYQKYTNYVLVRHEDNSFANYVHLQYQGALVEKGDRVKAGDRIALSGATGVATGPHLHFDIRLPSLNGAMMSIPFRFRGKDGVPVDPLMGRTYYAYHPGGTQFTEIRGKDIRMSQFENHTAPVPDDLPRRKLSLRKETYDDRLVLYIQNGNDFAVEAEIQLVLHNLESLRENPLVMDINAREEVFLTIVRVLDLGETYRIQSQIRFKRKN